MRSTLAALPGSHQLIEQRQEEEESSLAPVKEPVLVKAETPPEVTPAPVSEPVLPQPQNPPPAPAPASEPVISQPQNSPPTVDGAPASEPVISQPLNGDQPYEQLTDNLGRINRKLTISFLLLMVGMITKVVQGIRKIVMKPKLLRKMSTAYKIGVLLFRFVEHVVSIVLPIVGATLFSQSNDSVEDFSGLMPEAIVNIRPVTTIVFETIFLADACVALLFELYKHQFLTFMASILPIAGACYLIYEVRIDLTADDFQIMLYAIFILLVALLSIILAIFFCFSRIQKKRFILSIGAIGIFVMILTCLAYALYLYIDRSFITRFASSFCETDCDVAAVQYYYRTAGRSIAIAILIHTEWAISVGIEAVEFLKLQRLTELSE
ncbi:basic proline-rich protein [Gracilaria domingensis]|nr:basic proline-rich protein [Gracilaria domingensis]